MSSQNSLDSVNTVYIELEPGENTKVQYVFDFVQEKPTFDISNDWWFFDEAKGMIHIKFSKESRKRYTELSEKQGNLTATEASELDNISTLLNILPQMAASAATRIHYDHYKKESSKKSEESKEEKQYRTRKNAGDIAEIPSRMPLITNRIYQNAMTYNSDDNAYLQPLSSAEGLTFEDGRLILGGLPATAAQIKHLYTKDNIENFDLPLLRVFYAVILNRFAKTWKEDKSVDEVITIYYPDLAKQIGKSANISRNDVEKTISSILSFRNIIGITERGNNILPVLVYLGEDREKNTISFASPYMLKVIKDLSKASVRKSKQGLDIVDKNGIPQMRPAYTYIPDMELAKEKNKKAVEIVCIVVTTIEQAGSHGTPHISAKTILERNPLLQQSIDKTNSASNKNKYLERAFTKAWELLKTKTDIAERYKNIQLPDPKDKDFKSKFIPTMGTLDMVFSFPHEGKVKER